MKINNKEYKIDSIGQEIYNQFIQNIDTLNDANLKKDCIIQFRILLDMLIEENQDIDIINSEQIQKNIKILLDSRDINFETVKKVKKKKKKEKNKTEEPISYFHNKEYIKFVDYFKKNDFHVFLDEKVLEVAKIVFDYANCFFNETNVIEVYEYDQIKDEITIKANFFESIEFSTVEFLKMFLEKNKNKKIYINRIYLNTNPYTFEYNKKIHIDFFIYDENYNKQLKNFLYE